MFTLEGDAMNDAPQLMDEINRATWAKKANVHTFARAEGWTDPGERAAIERVVSDVRGQPILDLGVGGGRTVPLLRSLSANYTAIDYTPQLVLACQEKYPTARVLLGDARDLSAFGSDTFKLVVFSFNGIDAVNPDDRGKVLRETFRVLQKGGILLERQCEELENAGYLAGPEIYDNVHGRRIERGDDTGDAWWLHYLARKP